MIERCSQEWVRAEAQTRLLWVWTPHLIRAHHARLSLLMGAVEPASEWARELEDRLRRSADGERAKAVVPPRYVREWEQLVLARVRLAQGRASEALASLRSMGAAAESSGRIARLLENLL